MPGVGGGTMSSENAVETARLLNHIKPDFIRVRTFAMHPMSRAVVEDRTFVVMNDAEIVAGMHLLVKNLDEMRSYFSCADFSLNLLMQVDGYLDEKRTTCSASLTGSSPSHRNLARRPMLSSGVPPTCSIPSRPPRTRTF